jgi:hypothetical protein
MCFVNSGFFFLFQEKDVILKKCSVKGQSGGGFVVDKKRVRMRRAFRGIPPDPFHLAATLFMLYTTIAGTDGKTPTCINLARSAC